MEEIKGKLKNDGLELNFDNIYVEERFKSASVRQYKEELKNQGNENNYDDLFPHSLLTSIRIILLEMVLLIQILKCTKPSPDNLATMSAYLHRLKK